MVQGQQAQVFRARIHECVFLWLVISGWQEIFACV